MTTLLFIFFGLSTKSFKNYLSFKNIRIGHDFFSFTIVSILSLSLFSSKNSTISYAKSFSLSTRDGMNSFNSFFSLINLLPSFHDRMPSILIFSGKSMLATYCSKYILNSSKCFCFFFSISFNFSMVSLLFFSSSIIKPITILSLTLIYVCISIFITVFINYFSCIFNKIRNMPN